MVPSEISHDFPSEFYSEILSEEIAQNITGGILKMMSEGISKIIPA